MGRTWTIKEEAIVAAKYADTPTEDVAKELGVSSRAVRAKANNLGVRKEYHDSFIPARKTLRILELIHLLMSGKQPVEHLMAELEVNKRTIDRYIAILRYLEIKVEARGNKYSIPKQNCPLCGCTTNNHTIYGRP